MRLEPSPPGGRKRVPKDPTPRFKPDISDQLDTVGGCPALQLGKKHLARDVKGLIARVDTSEIEAKRSALGRHGFNPKHVLGVLVYGSLIGVHDSTKLAQRMETDAALRFVGGGHIISAGRLREFRRENEPLFRTALQQSVVIARELGLIDPSDLAVDSARIHADASPRAVRTLVRSRARVAELGQVDVTTLSDKERARHEEKLAKHRAAVEQCVSTDQPNYVVTSPGAALLKFPDGTTAPGHRLTVTAVGVKERLVLDVLVDASPNDFGKLGTMAERARTVLAQAKIDATVIQLAADAGFWSEKDLTFADANRAWLDALVNEPALPAVRGNDGAKLFTRSDFKRLADGGLECPAGTRMRGPLKNGHSTELRFLGVGCATCPLREHCTKSKTRAVIINPLLDQARAAMQHRMSQPGARERYNRRIATVEPVFSSLQDAMAFRRTTSRKPESVAAELVLKVLAYNLGRIAVRRRLRRVQVVLTPLRNPN